MGQVPSKLRKWVDPVNEREGFSYFCQGCKRAHSVSVKGSNAWGWNGDLERPTFTPSVLVTWPAHPDADERFKEWRTERRCHTFVTDGRVQFLGDCTHELAGQTLDLPDLPDWMRDDKE